MKTMSSSLVFLSITLAACEDVPIDYETDCAGGETCADTESPVPASPEPLREPQGQFATYRLTAIDSMSRYAESLVAANLTLEFTDNDEIIIEGPCSEMEMGGIRYDDGVLRSDSGSGFGAQCSPARLEAEALLHNVFGDQPTFVFSDDSRVLTVADDETTLTYEAEQSDTDESMPDIVGQWLLQKHSEPGAESFLESGLATIEFDTDGGYFFETRCYSVSGPYIVEEGSGQTLSVRLIAGETTGDVDAFNCVNDEGFGDLVSAFPVESESTIEVTLSEDDIEISKDDFTFSGTLQE